MSEREQIVLISSFPYMGPRLEQAITVSKSELLVPDLAQGGQPDRSELVRKLNERKCAVQTAASREQDERQRVSRLEAEIDRTKKKVAVAAARGEISKFQILDAEVGRLEAEATKAADLAIDFGKTRAVGLLLANNAATQVALLDAYEEEKKVGNVQMAAEIASVYEAIGDTSEELVKVRREQVGVQTAKQAARDAAIAQAELKKTVAEMTRAQVNAATGVPQAVEAKNKLEKRARELQSEIVSKHTIFQGLQFPGLGSADKNNEARIQEAAASSGYSFEQIQGMGCAAAQTLLAVNLAAGRPERTESFRLIVSIACGTPYTPNPGQQTLPSTGGPGAKGFFEEHKGLIYLGGGLAIFAGVTIFMLSGRR